MPKTNTLLALLLIAACSKTEETPAAKPSATSESTKPTPTAKKTVTLTSKSPEAIAAFEKGRDLIEKARGPEATEQLKKATELDPEFALAQATYASTVGGGPEAVKAMEAANAAAPKASEAERILIESYGHYIAGRRSDALAALRKLTKTASDDWHAWLLLGVATQRDHLYPEATAAFEKVRAMNPEAAMAWNGLAYTNAYQGKHDEAIAAARKQAELLPTEPNPQDTLGEVLLMAGKFEESEKAFQKALEINPSFGLAYQGVAFARAWRGDFKGAYEAYAKAMAAPGLRPADKAEGTLDLAWIKLAEGKTPDALATVASVEKDPAFKDLPHAIHARFDRVHMSDWLGKPKDAEKALAEATPIIEASQLPNKERFAEWLSAGKVILSSRAGKPDEQALAAYEAVAQKNPDDYMTRELGFMLRGLAAAGKGDAKTAVAELSKCSSDNVDCHYERYLVQKKAGDKMGADLTAKQIAATPLRSASALWVAKQGITAK
jgi:tetratricopeptide (TPR) repeat protein